jgi:hypothetical protein
MTEPQIINKILLPLRIVRCYGHLLGVISLQKKL